jgi:hypothetical protein
MSLRPFVLDVAGEIESLVREKGLTLSIGVPASLPKLRSDPLHVRQVLVNLLGNAVKFTPSGGRVSVRAALVQTPADAPPFPRPEARRNGAGPAAGANGAPRDDGGSGVRTLTAAVQRLRRRLPAVPRDGDDGPTADWVALQVVDTGAGIAPDHQARIFDEFEQIGPRTGDSAVRGTGLGLAISRRLAHLLDGELTLESAVGEGSTFTLWLPVDPVDVRPDRRPLSRTAGTATGVSRTAARHPTRRRTRRSARRARASRSTSRPEAAAYPFLNRPRRRPNRPSPARASSPAAPAPPVPPPAALVPPAPGACVSAPRSAEANARTSG